MATDVFISYRRKDLDFVSRLHQELTNRGITAWFDQSDIGVGSHWRTEIATGIRDCRVFIVVLSPDAVESRNIRKEVDLAEDHGKPIIPLVWRQTEIPEAFEYALAGIQWIVFNEQATQENFEQLAQVVSNLLGGKKLREATSETTLTTASPIPDTGQEETAAPEADGGRKLGGGRRLGGGRKLGGPQLKQNPLALYGRVMSKVITAADLGLEPEDEDYLNGELKWLFNATNLLYNIQRGQAQLDTPVPVPIPPDAERNASADNTIRPHYRDAGLVGDAVKGLEGNLKNISDHLKNLELLVDREVFGGEEAKRNVSLQNQIKEQRLDIVKIMEQIAATTNFYFDIKVTTPNQLKGLIQEA